MANVGITILIPYHLCQMTWTHMKIEYCRFQHKDCLFGYDSHYKDKVIRPSYLCFENSYTGRIASLYWSLQQISSTGALSSNELLWLDLMIGYQLSSPSSGHQGKPCIIIYKHQKFRFATIALACVWLSPIYDKIYLVTQDINWVCWCLGTELVEAINNLHAE